MSKRVLSGGNGEDGQFSAHFGAWRRLRREVRHAEPERSCDAAEAGGKCMEVSEGLHMRHGFGIETGAYLTSNDPRYRSVSHHWNVGPHGEIIDATADQFREGDDIRVLPEGHPLRRRYVPGIDGEDTR